MHLLSNYSCAQKFRPSLIVKVKHGNMHKSNAISNHNNKGSDVNEGSTLADFRSSWLLEHKAFALLSRGSEDQHRSLALAVLGLGLLASVLEDGCEAASNR
jgi:hypothetical protein